MKNFSLAVSVSTALMFSCDPTATRLSPKRLEFSFAASMASFDKEGNLLLTGFKATDLVRMNRQKLEFQDFSQGLSGADTPNGEILADDKGNLAVGGWYRAAGDSSWSRLPAPPLSTRSGPNLGLPLTGLIYTFTGSGSVFAVLRDRDDAKTYHELWRVQPPAGVWEKVAGGVDESNLESYTFMARSDGTVFIKNQVWVPGTTELKTVIKCPTLRIDQICEGGLEVITHPRRNETYLMKEPVPGFTAGKLYRLPADAKFPFEFDSLKLIELKGNQWRRMRVSADGVFHLAMLQDVQLDYPPYVAKEATYYAVTDVARAEAKLLYSHGQMVGDNRDIYQASAQLVGGQWVADPVYVTSF